MGNGRCGRAVAVALACGACVLTGPPAVAAPPFSAPVAISPPDSNYPELAMNARGDLVVAYTNVYDTAPRVEAVTQPAGAPFRPPDSLPAAAYNFPVMVRVDSEGGASVLWRQSDQGTPTAGHSQVWAAAGPVTTGVTSPGIIGDIPVSQLAVDERGDTLAVWADPNSFNDIMAAWRPAGGAFGPAQLIARNASFGKQAVAFDSDGRPLVVFSAVEPGHPQYDPARAYVVTGDTDGRFGPPQALSDPANDIKSNSPAIATSPHGDVVVTWAATQPPPPGYDPKQNGFALFGRGPVQAAFRRPGEGFGAPLTLADGATFPTTPAMDAVGNALVVGSGGTGGFASFVGADGALEPPHPTPGGCCGSGTDAVGFDARGNGVVVSLMNDPGAHRLVATIRGAGGAWLAPQQVFSAAVHRGPLFGSRLGFDGFGRGAVAFGTSADGRVHVAAYDSARLSQASVVRAVGLTRASLSVRYRLSRPALTRIRLERLPAVRQRARSARRRARPRVVRSLLVTGKAGLNRTALGGRRPAAGRYRLTVRPLDIAGRALTSRRLNVRF